MFDSTAPSVPTVEDIQAKYENDPNKAWQALAHSQAHIARLEAEAKARAPSLTLEQALEQIKTMNQSAVMTPPSQEPTSSPAQGVLDDTTLEQKLDKMLSAKAEKERRERAKQEVSTALLSKFGTVEKATTEMTLKAQELGMSIEALDAIALNSPVALLKLFGIENTQRQSNISPTMGNIRTNMQETKPTDVQAKYRDVLKTDRNKYMSTEVQTALMQDAYRAAGLITGR